jgi:uncharacterized protein YjbJ (UPF0337 family)
VETRGKKDDTLGEEVSALGQRAKGAAKDAMGDIIDDEQMEAEGERENAIGRARQATNNVMDETDGVRGATVSSGAAATGRTVTPGGYVTGIYPTPEAATRAYEGLTTTHGYKPGDINVVMSEETRKRHFGDVKPGTELSQGTKAAEGLGKGAAIGGGIGAALAALFVVGTSVVIPGIGLVVAGPIAAALAGAGAGGATGGLIGALIGAGIPEDRVRDYERGLNEGGILIGTKYRDPDHARTLERDYTEYGGTHVRY